LTGDKVDTAKNIGYSCRLLTYTGMAILEYPKDCENDKLMYETNVLREQVIIPLIQQTKEKAKELKTGLLVTGHMLDYIMKDFNSDLFKAFSALALSSDVVLCCRVSPKQKQEIVAMVKRAKRNAVTLSIGDGANDVNMITEAHVGIGIKGVEGQQASRAADFSIGEFRLLKRLMFLHGRDSYRKNAHLILYNFYKNILLCLPQFWLGFTNWLSGQTMYEEFSLQLYNLIYTAGPILVYCLFDKQTADEIVLSRPEFYSPGPKYMWFNGRRYLLWIGNAIVHSFIITLLA
jgi:phospholipid-transporting ATPase